MEKVKWKYRQRLQDDFDKYTKQIGIPEKEKPRLIMDRNTLIDFGKYWGIKFESIRNYGVCYTNARLIFVDTNARKIRFRTYKHFAYTSHFMSPHKATYRDYLHIMIHELVHYRFRYLQHGFDFEKRVREILRGKVFPEKTLFDTNTNKADQ